MCINHVQTLVHIIRLLSEFSLLPPLQLRPWPSKPGSCFLESLTVLALGYNQISARERHGLGWKSSAGFSSSSLRLEAAPAASQLIPVSPESAVPVSALSPETQPQRAPQNPSRDGGDKRKWGYSGWARMLCFSHSSAQEKGCVVFLHIIGQERRCVTAPISPTQGRRMGRFSSPTRVGSPAHRDGCSSSHGIRAGGNTARRARRETGIKGKTHRERQNLQRREIRAETAREE